MEEINITEEEQIFLDKVALEVFKGYLALAPLKDDKEVDRLSKLSYRAAAFMLEARRKDLKRYYKEVVLKK